jgi:DNA helicase II / ATP-dependent DNA helicase PcrA
MDVSALLDPLNDAQRAAVAAESGNLLVLAGAGSGKTRVLVHRIAWLVQVQQVPSYAVLAVTFTNKAAREMRGRIETMLGVPIGGMWVGTFHGLAHRFLRAHWQDAQLPQHFQILDSDDQFRLIKRILKAMQLDEARWPPRQVQGFINKQKDEGLRPNHLDGGGDFFTDKMIAVYRQYEEERARSGLLDFADLLLKTLELLRERPDILGHYQRRFAHILVDEFQDTNAIQYAWLRCSPERTTTSLPSATTISRSTAGAAQRSRISNPFSVIIPTRRSSGWSRITARAATSWPRPTP